MYLAFGVVRKGIQGVWNPQSKRQAVSGYELTKLRYPPLRSAGLALRDLARVPELGVVHQRLSGPVRTRREIPHVHGEPGHHLLVAADSQRLTSECAR